MHSPALAHPPHTRHIFEGRVKEVIRTLKSLTTPTQTPPTHNRMALGTSTVSGIIAGRNPLTYLPSNPITLFLFQAVFIISLCQIVHLPLGYIRQPRVIAEVIAGILLGPTVMGRIPNFTTTCFPTASIPGLTLVANLGVILFLFIVGLEVDVAFIRKNLRIALTVGVINMAIPFGFGCLIAIGLYDQYGHGDTQVKFTTYMVFVAVAMCITAFPVLARILTELRLLRERVGTVVLAAGITNDVVGWMLLALSVTLANAGSGITTLYILLVTLGWGLFVIFPCRWFLVRVILRRDLKSGTLSRFGILIILIMVFISSFFTDIIGVHPIFGAFLVGLIVPRDHGFVIEITHKIEDLVHIVLIPIYFALAGFNVNLGELNQGIDWGYIIALIVIAIVTKVGGGFIGAKISGYLWRESLAVGVLMSCKGIVEIVVLTVGLNAGIISHKVFSMFVLMTLVSTFLTTPLTFWVYPVSYREKVQRYMKGEIDWDGNEIERTATKSSELTMHSDLHFDKLLYNVDDSRGILSLLNFTELFYEADGPTLDVVLMKEFTERTADLIGASSSQESRSDPVLEILKKLFEYKSIPYVGDLLYFVAQHKTVTYLETSDNENDLMVYAVEGNQVDAKLAEELKREIIPQMVLLVKNSLERITELTLLVDHSEEVNILVLYLAKTILHNKAITKVNVIANGQDPQTVELFTQSLKAQCTLGEDHAGLIIGPLDLETVVDYAKQLQEQHRDALLVRRPL